MNTLKVEVFSEEVAALEHRLAEAEQTGNSVALRRLVAPDFTGVSNRGRRVDRDAFINAFTSPDVLIESLQLENVTVRVFEDVAISIGDSQARGTVSGAAFRSRYHFTDVWVRRVSRWELISAHVSPAGTP